jgi:hypothetical protein
MRHTPDVRRALVAAAAAALVLGCIAVAAAPSKPALRVVAVKPLVVQGQRFLPRERVVVTLYLRQYAGETVTRRAVAGRTGSFRVSFGEETFDRCSAPFLRANGSRGSRAVLKLPLPTCLLE